jgi:predicted DNA-binding helix-hairpin-helix protein
MEDVPGTPSAREFRLYQAEHLVRQYRFRVDELPFGADGNLPLEQDPKTAWALAHPTDFPLDVSRAPEDLLLRVPGIGPRAAERLVAERRRVVLRGAEDLRRLGVDTVRAGYFLTLGGRRLARERPAVQQPLFADGRHLPSVVWRTPTPPCAYR